MNSKKYQTDMGNIRNVMNSYLEQGKDVLFSAIFVTGKNKAKLIDRASPKQLRLVSTNLKYEQPDKIRIEFYDGKEAVNPLWLKEIILKEPEPEKEQPGYNGLGEAEINRIVDERFMQRKQQAEYEELKEQVLDLTGENEQLQATLDELEDKNAKLEQELESKKQIRYYTGMLGDILESFGIAKDRIKKPIAELMGITDSDEKEQKQVEAKKDDRSGIVDEKGYSACSQPVSTEEQKRNEIISLISEYLKTTNNQTLADVFSIFSEIEQDSSLANKIIQYLTTLKTKDNANV
jgi:predicted  nucleic acid-binding Zn-ribbon protein